MSCNEISKPSAWVEGSVQVKDLLHVIANDVISAIIPSIDGGVVDNTWEIVFEQDNRVWVEYTKYSRSESGKYLHNDGRLYKVFLLKGYDSTPKDENGYLWEASNDAPYDIKDPVDYRTGKKINVEGFTVGTEYYSVPGNIAILLDVNPAMEESEFENPWQKYKAYLVKHERIDYLGKKIEDKNWNDFELLVEMPDDWTYFLYKGSILLYKYKKWDDYYEEYKYYDMSYTRSDYTISNSTYFKPTVNSFPSTVVLKCKADGQEYSIYFEKPLHNNNYIIVKYGVNLTTIENVVGDSELTYNLACQIDTVGYGKEPVIINQLEAYKAYERQINGLFKLPVVELDGNESPPAYFFFSCDVTDSWVSLRKKPDSQIVNYYMSINNDRLLIVLEGDPAYDFDSYYRSFAYIGKFMPLNDADIVNNFAVTVGMGEFIKNKTGFEYKDVDKKYNPTYTKHGRYTSNGMTTVSVLRGITNLPYQEYKPAFLTQLPNYPSVGTLPIELKRLVLEKHGFQESKWTEHVHASPVYIFSEYEGYRGQLDGVVAVHAHNILNGDELEYDAGDFIEVYKFFNLESPINMFSMSVAPNMCVAILKETKNKL